MSDEQREGPDDRFGLCPKCHDNDGYYNTGRAHWFKCDTHQTRWCVGSNLFSSWRGQTEEEQREIFERNGYGDYEEVEPFHYDQEGEERVAREVDYRFEVYGWRIDGADVEPGLDSDPDGETLGIQRRLREQLEGAFGRPIEVLVAPGEDKLSRIAVAVDWGNNGHWSVYSAERDLTVLDVEAESERFSRMVAAMEPEVVQTPEIDIER